MPSPLDGDQQEAILEHYFKYHPPLTETRKQAHNAINESALAFAKTVLANVKDRKCREMAFFAIQQARMFANQGATLDEVLGDDPPEEAATREFPSSHNN